MFYSNRRRAFGFTLTEMAIVLAVVGVLAAGLWNLLSGANTQVRDESASGQQQQLISAVKSFLASAQGQAFMENNAGCTAGGGGCGPAPQATAFKLPLPTSCGPSVFPAPYAGDVNLPQFCNDLPPGFTSSTTNSYSQVFNVQVLRDTTANPSPFNTPPASYSFMILTSGGDDITDTSGARISSLIGSDGGFIFNAATGVCGGAQPPYNMACGSFGSWAQNVTGFGFAAPASGGFIASRTYMSPEQIQNNQWLARINLNVLNFTPNTMTVPEYLGDQALVMGNYAAVYPAFTSPNNTLYMGDYNGAIPPNNGGTFELQGGVINFQYNAPAAAGLGTMNVQGGTINLQDGTINLQGGLLTSDGNTSSMLLMINPDVSGGANTSPNPLIQIQSGCKQTSPGTPAACNPALQIVGDASVSNLLNANALYANTFIYQSSDIRLKKDIRPLQNSLADIMRLKPVSFAFKANDQVGLGVIAQDIEKVYPQLVSEGDFKSVNYEGLIGPLIEAVQELKRDNDQLRQQIQDQAVRERKLERELKTSQPAAN